MVDCFDLFARIINDIIIALNLIKIHLKKNILINIYIT